MVALIFPLLLALVLAGCQASPVTTLEEPWRRHPIDGSSRGADGVRAADVNGDGLVDFPTGWEEGGRVRAYLNPEKRTPVSPGRRLRWVMLLTRKTLYSLTWTATVPST